MNRLKDMFANGKSVFLPYVCCGDPNESFTLMLVDTLVTNGAAGIELGIPFSDPIADGKTIQGASERALRGGMTSDKAFSIIERIRKKHPKIAILVMTYYNIVFSYSGGPEGFVHMAYDAGADGLIVPDVPLEESDELAQACKQNNLVLIRFVTPNLADERLGRILECAEGFVYAVAVFGTTGARADISKSAIDLIRRIKKRSGIPVVVGFGIQNPKHTTRYIEAGVNGVIVGSAIIDAYMRGFGDRFGKGGETAALVEVAELAKGICSSIPSIITTTKTMEKQRILHFFTL